MEDRIESSPPHSPKKSRRRSSFFEKRQSISVAPTVEPLVTETTQEQLRNKQLQEYIEALSTERIAWKNFYSEEKKRYDDCIKQLKSPTSDDEKTVESLYSMLSDEDRELLGSGPDLAEVWRELGEACARAGDLMRIATRLGTRGERYQEHYTTLALHDQLNTSHR